MKMICVCRNCGNHYNPFKSRADYRGYCSQVCLHKRAKSLGYRKGGKSEYAILKYHNEIGDVPVSTSNLY